MYKRGKKYGIDYSVNGTRVRKIIGPLRKEAVAELARIGCIIHEGGACNIPVKRQISLQELIVEYLEFSKTYKRSWSRDVTSCKALSARLGQKLVGELTKHEVQQFVNARKQDEVKPATVNRELACLKHMFTKAVEWEYVTTNPLTGFKLLPENNQRTQVFSTSDLERLFQHLEPEAAAIVFFALQTGMRKGEIINLVWTDVDFEQSQVTVRTSKNGKPRQIPLLADMITLLQSLPRDSEFVFSLSGRATRCNKLRMMFEQARDKAGLAGMHFHDLRHTFATQLVNNNAAVFTVKELLGHATLAMTLRYTRVAAKRKREAIACLPKWSWHKLGTNLAQKVGAPEREIC